MSEPAVQRDHFVFTTLAIYQTTYWAKVALELQRRGADVAFIAFDDPSVDYLRALNLRTYVATPEERAADPTAEKFEAAVSRYGITGVNRWLLHERHVFAIGDDQQLRRNLLVALALAERALSEECRRGRPQLIQEVGGFLSVVGSFFVARSKEIDNWFIEPAFFRGHLFFYKNTFAAPRVRGELPGSVSREVRDYLARTVQQRSIVIPQKDAPHYRAAAHKVFNVRNARRLVEKLVDKYLRGKQMQFGYIGHHASTHIRMLANSMRLSRHYTPVSGLGRFVYFPLHVPGDMALTLRSPEYLDQLSLVAYLSHCVPHTHRIAVKEHPAMIGALDAKRLISIMARSPNIAVIPPETNNFEVLGAADAVISVNSKSGAEAALLGKPVLVLGDAFYTDAPLVRRVANLSQLRDEIDDALSGRSPGPARGLVESYFELVWRASYPGELFVDTAENVQTSMYSLLAATGREPFAVARVAGQG